MYIIVIFWEMMCAIWCLVYARREREGERESWTIVAFALLELVHEGKDLEVLEKNY